MISLDKKYTTLDGREVRIYAVDGGDPDGSEAVHGAYRDTGGWQLSGWRIDGSWLDAFRQCETDLIEVKPKITRTYWLVHFARVTSLPIPVRSVHEAWSCAAQLGDASAITGPHQVEFQEGDGL